MKKFFNFFAISIMLFGFTSCTKGQFDSTSQPRLVSIVGQSANVLYLGSQITLSILSPQSQIGTGLMTAPICRPLEWAINPNTGQPIPSGFAFNDHLGMTAYSGTIWVAIVEYNNVVLKQINATWDTPINPGNWVSIYNAYPGSFTIPGFRKVTRVIATPTQYGVQFTATP